MKHTNFITRSALMLALLIAVQAVTAPLGSLVTGSLVNLILIAAVALAGWNCGVLVALLSPILAKMFGIGPAFLPVIPVIILGNLTFVMIYALLLQDKLSLPLLLKWGIAVVLAAALKFGALYAGVTWVVIPLTGAAEPVAKTLSAAFGITQLFTALIGGAVSFALLPLKNKIER